VIPPDKGRPGPPGKLGIWGRPWHGLVEGGTLTLPNGDSMAHALPTQGQSGYGDVWLFRVPGTPAVARTPSQAAADAAAGRQWLDYALIPAPPSGRHLYGQPIGDGTAWLYAAPDGSRWLCTLAGLGIFVDLTAALDLTLTAARFGQFGAAAESHTLDLSLADLQQTLPGAGGGGYQVDAPRVGHDGLPIIIANAILRVAAASPTGDRAAILIAGSTVDNYLAWPNPLRQLPLRRRPRPPRSRFPAFRPNKNYLTIPI